LPGVPGLGVELPAHGRQAELLFLPEALDFEDELDVGGTVGAVPGAPPAGFEELALLLPIAQNVGMHPGDAAHLADGIKGFAGDFFFEHFI
jgi:hypothetical protein